MSYCTVLIWNNHMYLNQTYTGHAAMSIDENWSRNTESYVSWWPGEKDQESLLKLKIAAPNVELSEDLKAEKYAPDHIIRIEGLRREEMQAKWNQIKNKEKAHYIFLRKNCSDAVARVLKAGGGRGSAFARNSVIWTPLKVKELALSMNGEEKTWHWLLEQLVASKYMTPSDQFVLKNLYRRDDKHGKNATQNKAYYMNGERINDKQHLKWGGGFELIPKSLDENVDFFFAEDGALSAGKYGFVPVHNVPQLKRNFVVEKETPGWLVISEVGLRSLQRNRGLRPLEVIDVHGKFAAGDVITLKLSDGRKLGRGSAVYSSEDARIVKGQADPNAVMGAGFAPNRMADNVLLLTPPFRV